MDHANDMIDANYTLNTKLHLMNFCFYSGCFPTALSLNTTSFLQHVLQLTLFVKVGLFPKFKCSVTFGNTLSNNIYKIIIDNNGELNNR